MINCGMALSILRVKRKWVCTPQAEGVGQGYNSDQVDCAHTCRVVGFEL